MQRRTFLTALIGIAASGAAIASAEARAPTKPAKSPCPRNPFGRPSDCGGTGPTYPYPRKPRGPWF